ncbi:MAG: hypothetical protein WBP26_04075 [Candidatus Saccharimonadales bacterium]
MIQRDQRGEFTVVTLLLIIVSIFFVGAASFAVWAFMGRQDYKNNVDQKISEASAVVKKQTQIEDQKLFAEEAKNPFKTYTGPDQYGTLTVEYPKTWSQYVATTGTATNSGLDMYFSPDYVPGTTDQNAVFSLRIKVLNQQYATVTRQFTNNKNVTITPYELPKVKGEIGMRVQGQITPKKQGVMILLPVRDKTIQIWTESESFQKDLESIILPNLTFVP